AAVALRRIYADAETRLLERIARRLERGIDEDPFWAEQKLQEVRYVQREIEDLVTRLERESRREIETAVVEAYEGGALEAARDIAEVVDRPLREVVRVSRLGAVESIVEEAVAQVRSTHLRILRVADDIYRRTIAEATARAATGAMTRREAAQMALSRFADAGITGFVDRAGRRWDIASYAEMATRTATGRAAIQGHIDRLQANGYDLVIVSDSPDECDLCVVPGTLIEGPMPTWRCRLEYTGDVISITTAAGKNLTGTPDHTVLTDRGWVRLKDLNPGDKVVSYLGEKSLAGIVPDHVEMPTPVEEVGKAVAPLLLAGPVRRKFNGNRAYREVKIVWPDSFLLNEVNTALFEPFGDLGFVGGLGFDGPRSMLCDLALGGIGVVTSAPSVMGSPDEFLALLFSHGCVTGLQPFTSQSRPFLVGQFSHVIDDTVMLGASLNASATQVIADCPTAYAKRGAELFSALSGEIAAHEFVGLLGSQCPADNFRATDATFRHEGFEIADADREGGRYLFNRLQGLVTLDEIVDVSIRKFSGHVWDLQTAPSWYVSNGIISHNCRPWEGRVLSLSGATPGYPTLAEAQGSGLFHPSCTHSVSAYIPGLTERPKRAQLANPGGYEIRQQQRYNERM